MKWKSTNSGLNFIECVFYKAGLIESFEIVDQKKRCPKNRIAVLTKQVAVLDRWTQTNKVVLLHEIECISVGCYGNLILNYF